MYALHTSLAPWEEGGPKVQIMCFLCPPPQWAGRGVPWLLPSRVCPGGPPTSGGHTRAPSAWSTCYGSEPATLESSQWGGETSVQWGRSESRFLVWSTVPGASAWHRMGCPPVCQLEAPAITQWQVQMGIVLFLVKRFSDWYQGL